MRVRSRMANLGALPPLVADTVLSLALTGVTAPAVTLAGYVFACDPAAARLVLETITGTSREAHAELRRLLQVLRSDSDERQQELSTSDLARLDDLVTRVRAVRVNALRRPSAVRNRSPGESTVTWAVMTQRRPISRAADPTGFPRRQRPVTPGDSWTGHGRGRSVG
jgi:hypothetical protein